MKLQDIRFANLSVNFNANKIIQEVDLLRDKMFDVLVHSSLLPDQDKVPIFSEEVLQNASYYDLETNQNIYKKYEAWKGVSLTHIDYSFDTIKGKIITRSLKSDSAWEWREDIEIPYIRSVVEQFNFKVLHLVKVFVLPANGVGLVHQDDNGYYYNTGNFSITLNVANGNSPLVMLNKDQIVEVWPKQTHIFRDDCFHAIPVTSAERITIRINGKVDPDTIAALIEPDSLIYV